MPNRTEHVNAGFWTSASVAGIAAKGLELDAAAAQAAGCLLGGWLGSRLPDVLEPPIHPRHRQTFHSKAAFVGAAGLPLLFKQWMGDIRQEAAQSRDQRGTLGREDPEWSRLWRREMWLHFLVGLVLGISTAYALHLFMDSNTSPLPVI